MTDEVDGRPGHVALQSGHGNAHRGVLAASLSLPHYNQKYFVIRSNSHSTDLLSIPNHTVILSERSESKDLRLLAHPSTQPSAPFFWRGPAEGLWPHRGWPRVEENYHENLPGK